MLSNLKRLIRNWVLQSLGSAEIEDMLTNGLNDEDKAVLLTILSEQ